MLLQALVYLLTGLALTILAVSSIVLLQICAEALWTLISLGAKQLRRRKRVCAKALFGAFLVMGFPISLFADYAITITDAGYYQTVLDAQGVPSLVKIDKVFDLRTGGKTPTDTPPTTKIPEGPKIDLELPIVSQIGTAAQAVGDKEGSNALALVYVSAYDAYAAGKLDYDGLWAFIKEASNSALSKAGSSGDWTDVRKQISVAANERIQKFGQSKDVHAKLIASVQKGLDNSSAPILPPSVAFQIIEDNNALIRKYAVKKAGATDVN